MSDLGNRIDSLTPEKRALLEQELLRRRAARPASSGIQRRRPGQPFPLSFAQQRLWFLDQLSPGTSAYNASLTMRLDGPVDVDALRRSFDTIVERHEVLRTVIDDDRGLPKPRVLQDATVDLHEIDLRDGSGEVTQDQLAAALGAETRRPFDLARDVRLRVSLMRISERSHVLHMVLHHIASDGTSRGVLFDELSALYNAYVAGRPSPLPDLPIQYGDYALWQEEWLRGDVLRREVDWWREQLVGARTVLELPTDRPRPEVQEFIGARLPFTVPSDVSAAIKDVGRRERATLFMTILAVLGALLHLESGQDDILIGSPIANRQRSETEPLIGFFVNTLLLRVRLQGDPTFRELVGRARENAVGAYAHQDMPFEKLVETLRPRRHPGRNPLFQVNYRMQGPPPPPPQLTDLVTTRISTDPGLARFELALGIVDTPEELRGYLEYDAALFEPATAERLVEDFRRLLARVVAQPDLRLSELRRTT